MKLSTSLVLAAIATATSLLSCKKHTTPPVHDSIPVERKVKFELYTTQDFSNDNKLITFTLRISKGGSNGNTVIWDSVLAPIKVKDIPEIANKIVADKTILADKNEDLSVAFLYYIENVGISWNIDVFKAGETIKTFTYDFH